MVKQLIVLFIFLSSATFFRLTYLPKNFMLLISFGSTMLMAVTVILSIIYDRGKKFKQNFGIEISLILLSLLFAVFGAKWGHNQDFILTAWVQGNMYFFFFYFFLHTIRIRPEELMQMVLIMAFLYIGLFLLQYVLYPKILFGTRVQEARGTIRIFLPGGSFAGIIYFYFLQLIFTSKDKKYIIYLFLYLMIPLLQGTRSSIVTILFGTLLYILVSKRVKSKFFIMVLIFISGILVFLIFQDIIMNLVAVSQEQTALEGDDVRILSARFYLTEFYPSKLNYLIGNSQSHMMSSYGLRVWFYQVTYGFYLSDIGIIGEFVKYGVLYIISVFLIIRKIFIIKIEPKYAYFKYWAVLLIIEEILGGAFSKPTSIIVILLVLYCIDISSYELKHKKIETKEV